MKRSRRINQMKCEIIMDNCRHMGMMSLLAISIFLKEHDMCLSSLDEAMENFSCNRELW
jgi:hypothetical protein